MGRSSCAAVFAVLAALVAASVAEARPVSTAASSGTGAPGGSIAFPEATRRAADRGDLPAIPAGEAVGAAPTAAASLHVPLTTDRNGYAICGLVATGSAAVHAAYEEARGGINRVWYRRSTDHGATWEDKVQLSRPEAPYAFGAAVAGSASGLDAVWTEATPAGGFYVVLHAASRDGGLTWSAPAVLSSPTGDAGLARVARDDAQSVAVAWTDSTTGTVWASVSGDDGATFSTPAALATSSNSFEGGPIEAFADVAVSSAALHVAFYAGRRTVKLRRSRDGGVTWLPARRITRRGSGVQLDVAAAGRKVFVGYARRTATDLYAAGRRSLDNGAHWSAERAIAPPAKPASAAPVVAFAGGRWRAAYEQCVTRRCPATATYYRHSRDGLAWSAPFRVSDAARPVNVPAGATATDAGPLVLFNSYAPEVDDNDVVLGAGF